MGFRDIKMFKKEAQYVYCNMWWSYGMFQTLGFLYVSKCFDSFKMLLVVCAFIYRLWWSWWVNCNLHHWVLSIVFRFRRTDLKTDLSRGLLRWSHPTLTWKWSLCEACLNYLDSPLWLEIFSLCRKRNVKIWGLFIFWIFSYIILAKNF